MNNDINNCEEYCSDALRALCALNQLNNDLINRLIFMIEDMQAKLELHNDIKIKEMYKDLDQQIIDLEKEFAYRRKWEVYFLITVPFIWLFLVNIIGYLFDLIK